MANTKDKKTADLFKATFIKEMNGTLLDMQKDLEKKLGLNADDGTESKGTFPNFGDEEDDNVHEIEGFMVNENLKTQHEKELRDVLSSLKRMKKGTYGICKYTGEKISEKRLRARPTSSSSVEAKEGFQPKKKE